MRRPQLLLIDDSESFCAALTRALSRDYRLIAVGDSSQAREQLSPPPDAVLLDLRLHGDDPNDTESLELLSYLRRELPQVPVIMVTAYGDVKTAVECMQLGAADFIQKGGDIRELKARVRKALEAARVSIRLRQLEEDLSIVEPRELVGVSQAMHEIKQVIAAVARDAQVNVLISGETGTGKELVARSIHATGLRGDRAFVGVALAALPPSIVEAELFGYEPGAFTDARSRATGLIERAHGGILFLDEIGELPAAVQVKLLRFLEERVITRLGGQQEIPVDVQVVAATNAELPALIRDGRFRDDLYYRLKVCEIYIPPLRERNEDILVLLNHFLAKLGRDRGVTTASKEALEALTRYDWPGNARELRNALEAGILKASLHRHTAIEVEDLPQEFRKQTPAAATTGATDPDGLNERPANLEDALARTELEQVERALREVGGKKTEAWKLLGLNDRFVFTRRVRRLCGRYPELAAEFPAVQAAFGSSPGE